MIDAIRRKANESSELVASFFDEHAEPLARCVEDLAGRFRSGGRLLVMGNGGSSCDAQHVAVEFLHPIVEKRRRLPAAVVGAAPALLTAIGNDDDFSRVFVEELAAMGRPEDAVLGLSTSGASANVIRAMRHARDAGQLTIAFSGRDGGPLADLCEHAFVVPSWSVHRIQEVHTVLLHLLWDQVHVALGEDDVL